MGLGIGFGKYNRSHCVSYKSSGNYGNWVNSQPAKPENLDVVLPNPDPERFTIISTIQIGKSLVVEVNYPDCINYEGNKILVFSDCEERELRSRKTLDPHFSPDNGPIARFAPTVEGLRLAVKLAHLIKETK